MMVAFDKDTSRTEARAYRVDAFCKADRFQLTVKLAVKDIFNKS
jgi:hypothetical protein